MTAMQRQKLRSNLRKKFGHRNGRSSCAHSIGKFFLCYIVLFSFETSATGSPGNYLYIYIHMYIYIYIQYACINIYTHIYFICFYPTNLIWMLLVALHDFPAPPLFSPLVPWWSFWFQMNCLAQEEGPLPKDIQDGLNLSPVFTRQRSQGKCWGNLRFGGYPNSCSPNITPYCPTQALYNPLYTVGGRC